MKKNNSNFLFCFSNMLHSRSAKWVFPTISINPWKPHKGNLRRNHGLLSDILSSIERVWTSYNHLLSLNGKRQSDEKNLRAIMKILSLKPLKKYSSKLNKKSTWKKRVKLAKQVEKDFNESLKELKAILKNLNKIIDDDETFMFRVMKDLRTTYLTVLIKFPKNPAIPEHLIKSTLVSFYGLMAHIRDVQYHAWLVSKRHTRDFINIGDLTPRSNKSERRKIRKQTLALNHINNHIKTLKREISNITTANTQDKIISLNQHIHAILHAYHEELGEINHILHESDVFIRRTELLLKHVEQEAHALEIQSITKNIKHYEKTFKKLMNKIETKARREYLDVNGMFKNLPKPSKAEEKLKKLREFQEKRSKQK